MDQAAVKGADFPLTAHTSGILTSTVRHCQSSNPANMSSIDTSFPQFALFPFEIRRLIWCCCLPRRFVRLRRHSHRMWWDKCSTTNQNHRRHLPPLIALVCSESRAVALQHGALRSNISHAAAFAMNYAWVDTLRDVVLVDN